ncbi:MAG: glycosyltransferase, partial [Spartobacteria bacterium]|nr:glycosyltransferase [Spartobacteria bacterium]
RPSRPKDGLLRVAIIGSVAYPIKGAELILETIKITRAAVQWHFFGNTHLFQYQQRLESLKKNIVFHGAYARDQVVPLLIENSIDVSLFASIVAETFAFTLSESWMAGVPAMVPRLGALAERVGDTGFGWIVEPHVPAATVELIQKLIENRAEVERVRNLLKGFKHKTLEANAKEYLQLFAPMLRPLHAPARAHFLSMAAAQFDADEAVSRDKFETSIAEPVSLARALKPMGQVKLIGSPTFQTLRSSGNDPHLQVKFQGGYAPLFRLDIESPANTRLQMFYTTPDSPHFSEDKSVRRWLKKGRNEIFIDLPLAVMNLRLDPGETEGDFALYE